MLNVTLENQLKGLCVVCSAPVTESSYIICKKCNGLAQIDFSQVESEKPAFYNLKTLCCQADFIQHTKTTCGDKCHDKLVEDLEAHMGTHVKFVHPETKVAYKIPTRFIVEHGCDTDEMVSFPRWKD